MGCDEIALIPGIAFRRLRWGGRGCQFCPVLLDGRGNLSIAEDIKMPVVAKENLGWIGRLYLRSYKKKGNLIPCRPPGNRLLANQCFFLAGIVQISARKGYEEDGKNCVVLLEIGAHLVQTPQVLLDHDGFTAHG